jgi:hypothetical protein
MRRGRCSCRGRWSRSRAPSIRRPPAVLDRRLSWGTISDVHSYRCFIPVAPAKLYASPKSGRQLDYGGRDTYWVLLARDFLVQHERRAERALLARCWPRVSATAAPARSRLTGRLGQRVAGAGREYLLTARRGATYAHGRLPCLISRNHLYVPASQNLVRLFFAARGTTSPARSAAATMAGETQKWGHHRRSHRHHPQVSRPASHRPV